MRIRMHVWILLILCFSGYGLCLLSPQTSDRYFDTAELDHHGLRIAIFFSHQGSMRFITELNNKIDFLGLDQMTIITIYHEKEFTDFEKEKEFLKENGIDWIKFHRISSPISRDMLFQKSALSDEFKTIFEKSDGVIFFGGYDIPPAIYKKKTNLLTQIKTPFRHLVELSAMFHLLGGFQDKNFRGFLESEPDFPILCICLGCQTLNVGTGGTLIQDIWAEIYKKKYMEDVINISKENWHRNPFAFLFPEEKFLFYELHPIKLAEKGKFCTEMGFSHKDTPLVLSGHHQAIDKLGKGMKIMATSLDGKVVEALEHEKFPNVLGIQFHPDHSLLWDNEIKFKSTPDDKEAKSPVSILKENPPSFDFNQEIWRWFKEKVREFHKKRNP